MDVGVVGVGVVGVVGVVDAGHSLASASQEEIVVGVEVVGGVGFAEDFVGGGFEGSKHLAAKAPFAKQTVLPG